MKSEHLWVALAFVVFKETLLGVPNSHPGLRPTDRSINILGRSRNAAAEVGALEKLSFR